MPGGVVVPLPAPTVRAIQSQLPGLPIEIVKSLAINYQLERDHDAEAPASVKETLQRIAEQSAALYVSLGTLSEEAREQLWDATEGVGGVQFVQQLEFNCRAMMGLARNAVLSVEVQHGRPGSRKHSLVRSFAALLEAHGYRADAREKGDLCFLAAEVLAGLGEAPTNARDLVKAALAKTR